MARLKKGYLNTFPILIPLLSSRRMYSSSEMLLPSALSIIDLENFSCTQDWASISMMKDNDKWHLSKLNSSDTMCIRTCKNKPQISICGQRIISSQILKQLLTEGGTKLAEKYIYWSFQMSLCILEFEVTYVSARRCQMSADFLPLPFRKSRVRCFKAIQRVSLRRAALCPIF